MPTKTTTVTTEVTHDVEPLLLDPAKPEPDLGSVLLLSSTTGTAVQRFYNDGLYHSTTGEVFVFYRELFTDKGGKARKVYLLHEPKEV